MQTSFMHPPFGFALFFLRSVAPKEVSSGNIYKGAIPYVLLQIVMIGLVIAFPQLTTALRDKEVVVDESKAEMVLEQLSTENESYGDASGATDESAAAMQSLTGEGGDASAATGSAADESDAALKALTGQ